MTASGPQLHELAEASSSGWAGPLSAFSRTCSFADAAPPNESDTAARCRGRLDPPHQSDPPACQGKLGHPARPGAARAAPRHPPTHHMSCGGPQCVVVAWLGPGSHGVKDHAASRPAEAVGRRGQPHHEPAAQVVRGVGYRAARHAASERPQALSACHAHACRLAGR